MKILVPLKVPFDQEMAKIGIRLAKAMGAELAFLNVCDTTPFKGHIKVSDKILEEIRGDGELVLMRAREMAEKEGARAISKIVEGKPYKEIQKAAKDADIIVMRIRRFSSDKSVGSVTKDLLDHCEKPIYVFKGEQTEFNKLLVTLDDSECSKEAFEFSLLLAKQLGTDNISTHFVARSTERIEAGKKVLKYAQERGEERGIKVDTHLDDGNPAKEITAMQVDKKQ
jgi:nucleotide-binding universal stress UspA family protein